MDPDGTTLPLLLAFVVLLTNASFVTAEFALLSLRRAGVEPGPGDPAAASDVLERIDELSLVAQLGSSVSTVVLGALAARLGALLLGPGPLAPLAAVAVGVGTAAVVHAVLGAQIPKLLAIRRAHGRLARAALAGLRGLALVVRPLTWLVRVGLGGLARRTGFEIPGLYPLAHTPEEIRLLVAQGHAQGMVESDEREMIHGVFEFRETVAREVMTPRIDIVAVPVDIPFGELIETVVREGHSRIPVYEGTIDTVVGVLLTKDLLPLLADPRRRAGDGVDLRRVMREPCFVPDTKRVDELLAELRQQSVHLAVVVDEFGGTYGIVTMEDLLEEIVGEINDEHDYDPEPEFSDTPEGDVLIDGGAAISEVNERYGLSLPEEDFDTIGGFVFGALGRVPVAGDEVDGLGREPGAVLQVEEVEDRRITRVRLTRAAPASEIVLER